MDAALVADARRELFAALKADLPSDRAHAIEGIHDVLPAEAEKPILAGIDDANQIVRFAAALAAGELLLKVAYPKILAHLNDADPKVRVAIRFALHRLGDTSHSHDLEIYAMDKSPLGWKVRGATAMVLGRIDDPTVVNILRNMRADDNAAVRQQAEEALFRHDDVRAGEAMVGYTASRYPDDEMFGLMALDKSKDGKYRLVVRSQLTNEYSEVALVAARVLGSMNDDDGYGVVLLNVKAAEKQKRALAALAFGGIGRSDAQPYLAALLKDGEPEVRIATATAILRIANDPRTYDRSGNIVK